MLLAQALSGFAFAFAQTMVITALPTLKEDLHTSTTWVTWVATVGLIVSSVATPILSKLGDQFGRKRLVLISLCTFFVASLVAVVAPNIWVLILARAFMGAGGAVYPLNTAIIGDVFPRDRVAFGVGFIAATFPIGGAVGLGLSGVLVDAISWRSLFALGATVVGVATVLVFIFVPGRPGKAKSQIDVPGAVLLSATLLSFLLAVTEGHNWGWTSGRVLGLFALSAASLAGWIAVELRSPAPMIDLHLLTQRTVMLANVSMIFAGFANIGIFITLPAFIQSSSDEAGYGFGASATVAGLYLVPAALLGSLTGSSASGLARRWGTRWIAMLGMAMTLVGLVLLAEWHDTSWQFVLALLIFGAGTPLVQALLATLIVFSVPPEDRGVASGINTVMRNMGGAVGGQVTAAILASSTIAGTRIPTETAYVAVFWLGAALAAIGMGLLAFLQPRQPAHLGAAEAAQ
jgi:MFS family permease